MAQGYEELDFQATPMGELVLRVRQSPSLGGANVYEVKLDGAFLMSSVVTQSEEALANLAIAAWGDRPCRVLVGGLGLGYTAATALQHAQVKQVDVVEYLAPVIEWHRRRLVPAAAALMDDPRCQLIHTDFFELMAQPLAQADRRYDLILLDIDHSPDAWLRPEHEAFYATDGLRRMASHLSPEGIFALWSAAAPHDAFLKRLGEVFDQVEHHPVTYHHPMLHEVESNSVVLARQPLDHAVVS